MASTPNIYTTRRPVRLLWPHLFEARPFKDPATGREGEPKFDASFIIAADHPDLLPIKQFCAAVAAKAFPGRELKTLGQMDSKGRWKAGFPFESGTKRADDAVAAGKDLEFLRDTAVLTARTGAKYPPRLAVMVNGKATDYYGELRGTAQSAMYSGVNVLAEFNFQPYEGFGGGVTAYLNYVLSTNTGDRLSGGGGAEDRFSEYLGTITNEDPAAGMRDEEIPF